MRAMNKKTPAARPKPKSESASKRATKIARKGQPLSAKNPQDRSPKQENL
jgi:hypothetical protein